MNSDILIERIKELAAQKGESVNKSLLNAGVGKDFLYNLKRTTLGPSSIKVSKLADYFEVPIDYLLGQEKKSLSEKDKLSTSRFILLSHYYRPKKMWRVCFT